MPVVYEVFKREDGSVYGLGGSYELPQDEAQKLVDAGTHKFEDKPYGEKPAPQKKAAKAPVIEDEGVK